MRSTTFRSALLAMAAAPLVLAASACKDNQAGGPSGEPIAKIAPPAGQKWEETVSEGTKGGMVLGNPQAPIKVVEYGSLSCPHCARFAQEGMQPLINDFVASGRVSYEYRSFAIHPQDIPLTLLVKCAPKDAYFAMIEQVYTNFDALNAPLADPAVQQRAEAASKAPPASRFTAISDALGFTQFFAARGISASQANACLGNLDNAKAVAENAKAFGADGINGTPTFEINGNRFAPEDGTWAKISEALRRAGAR